MFNNLSLFNDISRCYLNFFFILGEKSSNYYNSNHSLVSVEQPPFMEKKNPKLFFRVDEKMIYLYINFIFFLPVIRFFSLVAVYLIGGVLFQIFVRKNSGKNAIPNASFWLDFPALVKVS